MKIGIALHNVGLNQAAFAAINGVNSQLNSNQHEFVLFYKEPAALCCKLAGPAMTFDKMYHFDGALIATSLDLAIFMIKTYTPKVKCLYLFDLEWIRGFGNYILNSSIYNHPDIKVIVPSKEYENALFNYCGRKADAVIPQFNLLEIAKVLEK